MKRRAFLSTIAATPALGSLFIPADDRDLLIALADAILPSELGRDGVRRTIDRFERWVSNFRPGAELNHGYGTAELQHLVSDPWPRWRSQLSALDADARGRYRSGFADIRREQRLAMITALLESQNVERIPPSPIVADHVALALLGWFYNQPEATDLAYRARIAKETCRPLGENANQPRPL
jgi:hypothetical protein